MNDTVSRAEVLKTIRAYAMSEEISPKMIYQAVLCMEDAEPECKTGRWELHTYIPHKKYCTNCKKDSPYNLRWDYCPNCGSKMEV